MTTVVMEGVREYCEEYPVELTDEHGRYVVIAYNEAGHNSTQVDLLGLLAWLREHRPELLEDKP